MMKNAHEGAKTMTTYRITSKISGVSGIYQADDEAKAYLAMLRDAGYDSPKDAPGGDCFHEMLIEEIALTKETILETLTEMGVDYTDLTHQGEGIQAAGLEIWEDQDADDPEDCWAWREREHADEPCREESGALVDIGEVTMLAERAKARQ